MKKSTLQLVVHSLSLTTGVLGIISANGAQLGIPAYGLGIIAVLMMCFTYIANGLPALNSSTSSAS